MSDYRPCRGARRHSWTYRGYGYHSVTLQHVTPDERICVHCDAIQVAIDSKKTRISVINGLPEPVNTRWVFKETK